jgi:hypothetical protein
MGIFKNITKVLKKAAPLIGSTIGFALGGPAGAALGSGIGSLASGKNIQDALLNAGLAYGVGTFAKGAGFGKATGTGIERLLPSYKGDAAFGFGTMAPANEFVGVGPTAIKSANTSGILSKLIPESTVGKIALGSAGLGLLGGMGEEQQTSGIKMRPDPVGRTRLGTGRIGNKLYNLDDPDERRQYFEDNRKRQGAEDIESKEERDRFIDVVNPRTGERDRFIDVVNPGIENLFAAAGGEVKGPGTGTSDSVPARLSDGEFVVTAKAVRGAGGGDRNIGAARMYDMMSNLERVA